MMPEPEIPEGLDGVRAQQLDIIAVELVDLLQLEALQALGRYITVDILKGALEATGFDELPAKEYDYLLSSVGYVATEQRDLYVLDEELYDELKTLYHEFEKKHGLYEGYENAPDQPEGTDQGQN